MDKDLITKCIITKGDNNGYNKTGYKEHGLKYRTTMVSYHHDCKLNLLNNRSSSNCERY